MAMLFIIFGIIGIIISVAVWFSCVSKNSRCSEKVVATVSEIVDVRDSSVSSKYGYYNVYKYTYNGKEYSFQDVHVSKTYVRYDVGEQISIMVNPDNPDEHYRLDKYEDWGTANPMIILLGGSGLSAVFILIGINDLELKVDDDVVVNNIRKIVQGIKKNRRYAKIYVESIYPINNSDDDKIEGSIINGNRKNSDIIDINNKLVKLTKEEGATYIDLHKELVDDNGLLKIEYTVDGLHLSSEGYEKVTEVLRKYITNKTLNLLILFINI